MKLPEEWNFSGLPKSEVHLAFFYEFGRESERIRELVEQARQAREMPNEMRQKVVTLIAHALNKRQKPDGSGGFWDHHLWVLLCWLAAIKQFPKTSWETLPREVKDECSYTGFVAALPAVELWPEGLKTLPHQSLVAVDWRASNSEILEALQRIRPKRFRKVLPEVQRAIDGTKLPFRKSNALDWLGWRRCRKSVSTWKDFGTDYRGRRFGDQKSGKDDMAWARPYKAHVHKAALILEWFANGTPLDPADFK